MLHFKLELARQEYKKVHSENTVKNISTLADDLKLYSDEGLINFEERLSKEIQNVNIDDDNYDELLHTYNTLHDELINRGLVEFPF